ncbi:Uncharacterised protein [BD1-7 clade bacterium]|uniref:Ricin B lectin domain-containing protein n=1 Tax=BD1-7 clade bacterium TaxID=2029982 RepID=A0A5S9PLM1_9GAMM|nr:Uncharacterised protein [BD1-7 clade bacterium]CAA0105099.1 Uncharacterised protein [BD1-7 clade bacterium]
MKTSRIAALACAPVLAYSLSGCIDDANYSVSQPQSNTKYVGTSVAPDNNLGFDMLPGQFVVTYDENPGTVNIYLNGNQIEQHFSFGPKQATADASALSDYLKQGENLLTVNPLGLGPTIAFTLDSKGPSVVIESVEYSNPADKTSGTVNISGKVNDASSIDSLVMKTGMREQPLGNEVTATLDGNNFSISNVPVSFDDGGTNTPYDLFGFAAEDEHGYQQEISLLRNGAPIDPLMAIRIDEVMLLQLVGFISSSASCKTGTDTSGYTSPRQLTENEVCTGFPPGTPFLDNLAKLSSGIMKDITIEEMHIQNMEMRSLSFDENGDFVLDLTMYPQSWSAANDPANPINGQVDNNSQVGVYVIVSLKALGIPITMDLFIESVDVKAKVKFAMENRELTVEVTPATDASALDMHDLRIENGTALGIDISGLLQSLIAGGGLDGIILSTIQGALDENLTSLQFPLTFGKTFDTPPDADDFKIDILPESAGTNAGVGDTAGNLSMDYTGVFEALSVTPNVPQTLGSYYVNDGDLPPVAEADVSDSSSLVVSVNTNMINQMMLTMFNAGLMHMNVLSGDATGLEPHLAVQGNSIFFGPDGLSDSMGAANATRTRLIPTTPPNFRMLGDGTTQANISYVGASMEVDRNECSDGVCEWKNRFNVNLDIEAGVTLDSRDDVLFMTINGNPSVQINSLEDNLDLPFGLKLSDSLVQSALDLMIAVVIPQIAETELKITVSELCALVDPEADPTNCWSSTMETDSVSSQGGHLSFKMGIDRDLDGDGVDVLSDNCPFVANPAQTDADNNGIGLACEPDTDLDTIVDEVDNCKFTASLDQSDADGDGAGNLCDIDYLADDKWVHLRNGTGKCLARNGNGNAPIAADCADTETQRWYMEVEDGGSYWSFNNQSKSQHLRLRGDCCTTATSAKVTGGDPEGDGGVVAESGKFNLQNSNFDALPFEITAKRWVNNDCLIMDGTGDADADNDCNADEHERSWGIFVEGELRYGPKSGL